MWALLLKLWIQTLNSFGPLAQTTGYTVWKNKAGNYFQVPTAHTSMHLISSVKKLVHSIWNAQSEKHSNSYLRWSWRWFLSQSSSLVWTTSWKSFPCAWGTGWRTFWWLCTSATRTTTCWLRSRSSGWEKPHLSLALCQGVEEVQKDAVRVTKVTEIWSMWIYCCRFLKFLFYLQSARIVHRIHTGDKVQ